MLVKEYIREIQDFPSVGITYRDITPLIRDPEVFRYAIDTLYFRTKEWAADLVVGIEPRGCIVAPPLAIKLGIGLATAKKRSGDHPMMVDGTEYALEMGTDNIAMLRGSIKPGDRVIIADDILATGVTAKATADLVEDRGGKVLGFVFLADINFYDGEKLLEEIAQVIHVYDC